MAEAGITKVTFTTLYAVHTSADSDLSSLLVAVHLVDRIETRALRAALEANIRAGAGGRRVHVGLPHQSRALEAVRRPRGLRALKAVPV